jgi:hypothetical protein
MKEQMRSPSLVEGTQQLAQYVRKLTNIRDPVSGLFYLS